MSEFPRVCLCQAFFFLFEKLFQHERHFVRIPIDRIRRMEIAGGILQPSQIILSIRVAAEDHLALNTSANNMVKPTYSTRGYCATILRFYAGPVQQSDTKA